MVLRDISLEIKKGEIVCVVGPSGCGKSTLLSLLGGFEPATAGEILINGSPVRGPSRRVITVFQEFGLLPWRSVQGNVQFGLEILGTPQEEYQRVAAKYTELVGLSDSATKYPHELSGGMKQRAAIARALAVEPQILLMDEPFNALDMLTRMRLQRELVRIWSLSRRTIVFVTHDIEEAVFLGSRIVVLGGTPSTVISIVPVNIPHPRRRTSPDFHRIKAEVMASLGLEQVEMIEYVI